MIETAQGNPFEADVEALVNTIDASGQPIGRAGVRFKKAYPDNAALCLAAGRAGRIAPEQIVVYGCHGLFNPRYFLNLAVAPSRQEPICPHKLEIGLAALAKTTRRLKIASLAVVVPESLETALLRQMLERAFARQSSIKVTLFEPELHSEEAAAPAPPPLSPSRAQLLALIDAYGALGYPLRTREIHTLAYLLQAAGEPLKLVFDAADDGLSLLRPERLWSGLESHYLQQDEITNVVSLLPEGREDALALLSRQPDAQRRLGEVSRLIEGFETPYGLALLAAVHWVAHRGGCDGELPAEDQETATALILRWQKATPYRFTAGHIGQAWGRLARLGWLSCLQGGDEREGEPV